MFRRVWGRIEEICPNTFQIENTFFTLGLAPPRVFYRFPLCFLEMKIPSPHPRTLEIPSIVHHLQCLIANSVTSWHYLLVLLKTRHRADPRSISFLLAHQEVLSLQTKLMTWKGLPLTIFRSGLWQQNLVPRLSTTMESDKDFFQQQASSRSVSWHTEHTDLRHVHSQVTGMGLQTIGNLSFVHSVSFKCLHLVVSNRAKVWLVYAKRNIDLKTRAPRRPKGMINHQASERTNQYKQETESAKGLHWGGSAPHCTWSRACGLTDPPWSQTQC